MLNNITKNKIIKYDLVLITCIIILPFLFYIYTFIPEFENRLWKTKWFTFDSGYFKDVYYYGWLLSCKFLTLTILSIWYLSCIHKWKLVLMFPIFAEILKIYVNIDYANYNYINNAFYYSILNFVIYVVFLIYLSKRINFRVRNKTVSELLNNEINSQLRLLNKSNIEDYKYLNRQIINLKKNKDIMNKKHYLKQLIAIRDRLTV